MLFPYKKQNNKLKTYWRCIMAEIQNYIETDAEREEGHVDTRSRNFECDNADPSLGCNMGIDVQG
ncbi:hypothetical protein D3OALGB2SA_557 [Olavius algarvensis associated proteobacterium Delta 3]|nr:hypothetical protein D3OALGB2SA_557 [Olavius algarvensis associated proteobacterium Delta 3]